MDDEMQEFEQQLMNGLEQVQNEGQIPRRLVLGRSDYKILTRIKKLYPAYPETIGVAGQLEIERTPTEHYFDILP